jgi:hypothetical protein
MGDQVMDAALKVVFAALIITFIGFFVYVIPLDMDRTKRAEQLATEMGCTYIGNARDLNSVKFFQCGENIVLRRVK